MAGCAKMRMTQGKATGLPASIQETWLFWNYESVNDFTAVKSAYSRVTPRALSPDVAHFIYEVYFTARKDLIRLGFTGFNCPKSLSSGMHAIIMASAICRRVRRGWCHMHGTKGGEGGCDSAPRFAPVLASPAVECHVSIHPLTLAFPSAPPGGPVWLHVQHADVEDSLGAPEQQPQDVRRA